MDARREFKERTKSSGMEKTKGKEDGKEENVNEKMGATILERFARTK